MSVIKTSLSLPHANVWKPIEKKNDNSKLNHLYHIIQKVHEDLQLSAPNQAIKINKYDLVTRNVNEALLLIAFREKQSQHMDKYTKKLQKFVCKI